ncbi:MAG: hypothetical protein AB1679_04365 [Actinomycetota bacterium]
MEVEADLLVADEAWAGAVVCHPHPAYGGDRHNVVVDRIFRTLGDAGVAVAPPLRFGPPPCPAAGDTRPVLVLAAQHDQFTSPDHLHQVTATWPDATVAVIHSTNHFLAGTVNRVAETILAWLRDRAS